MATITAITKKKQKKRVMGCSQAWKRRSCPSVAAAAKLSPRLDSTMLLVTYDTPITIGTQRTATIKHAVVDMSSTRAERRLYCRVTDTYFSPVTLPLTTVTIIIGSVVERRRRPRRCTSIYIRYTGTATTVVGCHTKTKNIHDGNVPLNVKRSTIKNTRGKNRVKTINNKTAGWCTPTNTYRRASTTQTKETHVVRSAGYNR